MAFIKNLDYQVDQFNLNIPYLEIKDKQINLLMGASGSGKTTLFNLMTGYIPYANWSFEIEGVDITKLEVSQKNLGIVFQTFELFPHLTAQENIEIVMKAKRLLSEKNINELTQYKKILNLDRCWQTKAENLSGGEKQRVSILRAIISKPRMLLLDEPFSALDEANKEEARKLIKQVVELSNLTTLMISHDPADAKLFGQNLIRLNQGQLIA